MNKLLTIALSVTTAILIPTAVRAEPSFTMTETIDGSMLTTYCEQVSNNPILFSCTSSILTVGETRIYNGEETLRNAESVVYRGGTIEWVTPPPSLSTSNNKPNIGDLYGQGN